MSVVWTESLQHSDEEKILLEKIHAVHLLSLTEANIAITHTNCTSLTSFNSIYVCFIITSYLKGSKTLTSFLKLDSLAATYQKRHSFFFVCFFFSICFSFAMLLWFRSTDYVVR